MKTAKAIFGLEQNRGLVNSMESLFQITPQTRGLVNSQVKGIVEDNNGDIWFCTYNSGIYKYDGKFFEHFLIEQGLPTNKLSDIIKDRQGNLWMAYLWWWHC